MVQSSGRAYREFYLCDFVLHDEIPGAQYPEMHQSARNILLVTASCRSFRPNTDKSPTVCASANTVKVNEPRAFCFNVVRNGRKTYFLIDGPDQLTLHTTLISKV